MLSTNKSEECGTMYALFMLIWAMLITPVHMTVFAASSNELLPGGYVIINIFCFRVRVSWQLKQINRSMKIVLGLGKRRFICGRRNKSTEYSGRLKALRKSPAVRSGVRNIISSLRATLNGRISLGDAAATALFCVLFQQILCRFQRIDAAISPDYGDAGYILEIKCMLFFRLGMLLFTAAACFAALKANKSGGTQHGKTGSVHQFRYADRP